MELLPDPYPFYAVAGFDDLLVYNTAWTGTLVRCSLTCATRRRRLASEPRTAVSCAGQRDCPEIGGMKT
jgi:hypothetical protein